MFLFYVLSFFQKRGHYLKKYGMFVFDGKLILKKIDVQNALIYEKVV